MRELTALQPYFDRLLLIPGMEMTTFQGHANALNLRDRVDFRVGSAAVPDWNSLLAEVASRARLCRSTIHACPPAKPAWVAAGHPAPVADMSLVQAVEVVNGHDVESATAGVPFIRSRSKKHSIASDTGYA